MAAITFEDVVNKLTSIATTAGAESVAFGIMENDFDRYKDLDTPTVFIDPDNNQPATAVINRTFNIYVYDLLNHDQSNMVAKLSSTEAIALSILAQFENVWANQSYTISVNSMDPQVNATPNSYTGWALNLTILTAYPYDVCE